MSIFAADGVGNVLHSALNGISMRERVIADNIANVDTPDFRARSVDFETSLRSVIDGGRAESLRSTVLAVTSTPTQTPVGANGNNVDLRKETMAAMQSVYPFQIVSRPVSDRLELARTAAGAF